MSVTPAPSRGRRVLAALFLACAALSLAAPAAAESVSAAMFQPFTFEAAGFSVGALIAPEGWTNLDPADAPLLAKLLLPADMPAATGAEVSEPALGMLAVFGLGLLALSRRRMGRGVRPGSVIDRLTRGIFRSRLK